MMEMTDNKTQNITQNETENPQNIYLNWLYHIPGIGRKRLESILEGEQKPHWFYTGKSGEIEKYLRKAYGAKGMREAFAVSDAKRIVEARKFYSPEKLYEDLKRRKIEFVSREDEAYPARLRQIPDAPIVLYRMGKERNGRVHRPVVAVVGTRNCSEYGRAMAKRIGELCGEMGIGLVSGLASGIDGISQWWALQNGGEVTAVLGCGVDICYPWENKKIYAELLEKGVIYSEYIPGTEPKATNFPPRNRIISGLADGVIVVEAKEKSGTLITVDMALEQGKEVYVVPGRITDPLSAGCNRLISQGAEMIVNPEKTLAEIAFGVEQTSSLKGLHNSYDNNNREDTDNNVSHPAEEKTKEADILRALDFTPLTVQEIYEKIKPVTLQDLQQKLLLLEMRGMIFEKGGRFYRKS